MAARGFYGAVKNAYFVWNISCRIVLIVQDISVTIGLGDWTNDKKWGRKLNSFDGDIKIFAGSSGIGFAKKMCKYLGNDLGDSEVITFSDGNIFLRIKETVRNKDVYVVQPIGMNPNNEFVEILFWMDAVKSGAIKRFIVMAGCDGRHKSRNYFTEVAQNLPKDAVILTAGCAKYRYNKLDLGDIGGIPRVLDAGQCNDCYSLAVIALKLKEVFGLDHINDLPLSFDIGWYEQKAAAVLLALLYLGVKGIRLGPTLPAFVSPNVLNVLVEKFDIKPTGEVAADIEAMMAGH